MAGEMVVRGGCLSHPVVLTNLLQVEGKMFLPLHKTSKVLYSFLTESPMNAKVLAHTNVWEEMAKKRKEARINATKKDTEDDEEDDLVKALEVTTEEEAHKPALGNSLRTKHRQHVKARAYTVSYGQITLEREDVDPWQVHVLFDVKNTSAVAMEVSAHNLQQLHQFVAIDLAAHDRDKTVTQPRCALKPPRGEPGKPSYWCESKQRWVTKVFDKTAPSGYRTVLRSASDASSTKGDAKKRPRIDRDLRRRALKRMASISCTAVSSTGDDNDAEGTL